MSSIFKIGKYWQIQFYWNGELYRYSLRCKKLDRANYLQKVIDSHLEAGIKIDKENLKEILYGKKPEKIDLFAFLKRIATEIKKNNSLSPAYRERLQNYLNNFKRFLKKEKIRIFSQIDTATAIDYRNWRLNTPGQKPGTFISPKTVRDELMFLKNTVFERAVDEGLIPKNPFQNALKGLKVHKTQRPPFTIEEVRKLIENAPNQLHRRIYTIAFFTGARFGEIANLEWQDLDFENRLIYIRDKKSHRTKTRKTRIIPMHPELIEVFEKIPRKGKYVFPSPVNPGHPIKSIRTEFNRLKRRLGIDESKSLHSFRHSLATELVSTGADISIIKEILGHTDLKMTNQYQEIRQDVKAKAIEKISLKK